MTATGWATVRIKFRRSLAAAENAGAAGGEDAEDEEGLAWRRMLPDRGRHRPR